MKRAITIACCAAILTMSPMLAQTTQAAGLATPSAKSAYGAKAKSNKWWQPDKFEVECKSNPKGCSGKLTWNF
ncbi:MAG: hypothetical protein KDD62_09970 [Bdellovibrionales bacterium]|nr:hypothetical protein [Bdellovibrionales bacterium]